MLLFRAIKRGDTKPLAKTLIAKSGSFAEVISAAPQRLRALELSAAAIILAHNHPSGDSM